MVSLHWSEFHFCIAICTRLHSLPQSSSPPPSPHSHTDASNCMLPNARKMSFMSYLFILTSSAAPIWFCFLYCLYTLSIVLGISIYIWVAIKSRYMYNMNFQFDWHGNTVLPCLCQHSFSRSLPDHSPSPYFTIPARAFLCVFRMCFPLYRVILFYCSILAHLPWFDPEHRFSIEFRISGITFTWNV